MADISKLQAAATALVAAQTQLKTDLDAFIAANPGIPQSSIDAITTSVQASVDAAKAMDAELNPAPPAPAP